MDFDDNFHAYENMDLSQKNGTKHSPNQSDDSSQKDATYKKQIYPMFMTTANTIVHMMIAIVLFMTWYVGININFIDSSRFVYLQLHIIFSTTGFLFFMVEAILSFSPFNAWTHFLSRDQQKHVHVAMQTFGAICIVIGFSFIVSYKADHFTTTHGILGLVSFILTMLGCLNGVLAFFVESFIGSMRQISIRIVHTLVGFSAVTMGLITIGFGMNKTRIAELTSYGVPTTVLISLILFYLLISVILRIRLLFANMKTTEL